MLIDDVVGNHHAIAIEGRTDGACCRKGRRELAGIHTNFVLLQTSPRRVRTRILSNPGDRRRRSSEPGRDQRGGSQPSSGKLGKMMGLHLFSQSGKIRKSIKDQVKKKFPYDDQSRAASI